MVLKKMCFESLFFLLHLNSICENNPYPILFPSYVSDNMPSFIFPYYKMMFYMPLHDIEGYFISFPAVSSIYINLQVQSL